MGGANKDKKRKKSQTSPDQGVSQRQTKKSVMATQSTPPGYVHGLQQASQFNNTAQPTCNYAYPPQFCLQNAPVTPVSNTPVHLNQGNDESVMGRILDRLEKMDKKLCQLDSIQGTVNTIQSRVINMEDRLGALEKKVNEVESSREFDSKSVDIMGRKQAEIDSLLDRIQTLQQKQVTREQEMAEEMLDLKSRSMRDNLVFYNIDEKKDEDCMTTILKFIEKELKIENAEKEIKLHRAHRMGKYVAGKTRPIVAKFTYYPDREKVRKASNELSQTKYGVSQQFPKEIQDRRRELVPILKKAREEGKEAYITVDKLYINGHLYRPQGRTN